MTPWWMIDEAIDIQIAQQLCGFMSEIESGDMRSVPKYIQDFRRMMYADVG